MERLIRPPPGRSVERPSLEQSGLLPLEQVVAHPPLLATAPREELLAGHEEDAPPHPPAPLLPFAVGRPQDGVNGDALRVHALEPGAAGPCVVPARHGPALDEPQVALEVEEEV